MSLSRDFGEFERECGYTSKRDQLVSAMRSGRDVAVHRIGGRLSHYIARSGPSPASCRTRKVLDAAIRLGIKLEVLDWIEIEAGLHPSGCLSLLLGFDCAKLSRLSYSSLRYVQRELGRNTATLAAVTRFGDTTGGW